MTTTTPHAATTIESLNADNVGGARRRMLRVASHAAASMGRRLADYRGCELIEVLTLADRLGCCAPRWRDVEPRCMSWTI